MSSVPPIVSILPIVATEEATVHFLLDNNLCYNLESGAGRFACRECGTVMTFCVATDSYYKWQCPSWECLSRQAISWRTDSFFFNYKVELNKVLLFLYFWAGKSSMSQMVAYSGVSPGTGRRLMKSLYYALEESLDEESLEVGK
jgi:hypothetical protein